MKMKKVLSGLLTGAMALSMANVVWAEDNSNIVKKPFVNSSKSMNAQVSFIVVNSSIKDFFISLLYFKISSIRISNLVVFFNTSNVVLLTHTA